ncbi:hypothetical protein LCGC14_1509390 [marine sediment metagenome]|uniref:Uncharacterized protein n=1 Tax=marine sediment metagenome TaxID=412755 RepID=A0A0F9J233_9ZZZZ
MSDRQVMNDGRIDKPSFASYRIALEKAERERDEARAAIKRVRALPVDNKTYRVDAAAIREALKGAGA